MKILFQFETDEIPTNFRIAEAIMNLGFSDDRIDPETVAKMVLLQADLIKKDQQMEVVRNDK